MLLLLLLVMVLQGGLGHRQSGRVFRLLGAALGRRSGGRAGGLVGAWDPVKRVGLVVVLLVMLLLLLLVMVEMLRLLLLRNRRGCRVAVVVRRCGGRRSRRLVMVVVVAEHGATLVPVVVLVVRRLVVDGRGHRGVMLVMVVVVAGGRNGGGRSRMVRSHRGRLIVLGGGGSLVRVPGLVLPAGRLVVAVQDAQGVVDAAMLGGAQRGRSGPARGRRRDGHRGRDWVAASGSVGATAHGGRGCSRGGGGHIRRLVERARVQLLLLARHHVLAERGLVRRAVAGLLAHGRAAVLKLARAGRRVLLGGQVAEHPVYRGDLIVAGGEPEVSGLILATTNAKGRPMID